MGLHTGFAPASTASFTSSITLKSGQQMIYICYPLYFVNHISRYSIPAPLLYHFHPDIFDMDISDGTSVSHIELQSSIVVVLVCHLEFKSIGFPLC